jgi:hypothetical protein
VVQKEKLNMEQARCRVEGTRLYARCPECGNEQPAKSTGKQTCDCKRATFDEHGACSGERDCKTVFEVV